MGNKRSKTQNPAILTNPEIAFLESKTGLSRTDIQAWHSQFLLDNPSGYIDLKHFERIYKELFPNGNASQTAKLAFKAFDTDNTGKITFSEFLIATAVPQTDDITYETKEQIEQLFELYDTNGDGYIDRREMKYFLEALCQSEGRSTARVNDEINRVFREFDYNRDNRLSKNETIDFILSRPF